MSRPFIWVLPSIALALLVVSFALGFRIGEATSGVPSSCATALESGERYIKGLESLVRIKIDYISLITQPYATESEKNFLAEVQDNQIKNNDQAVIEYVQAKQDCDRELG